MRIIVTGSLAFDQIMDFPGKFSDHILPEKIHQINLSFLVNKLTKQRGGTAGNIAYNLALLGMKPTILATAGYDFADYRKELVKVGVDDTAIRITVSEPTASAFIFTDQADNQITGFYPGAMSYSSKLKIENLKLIVNCKLKIENLFVVISPNDPLAMMNHVRDCQKLGFPYLFDPGMQLPRLSDEDLKMGIEQAAIVIGNDYEMALINKRLKAAKGTPPRWQAERSEAMTPRTVKELAADQLWITTLGAKGSIIEARDTIYSIPPALPKRVLDPTGAGDAFRAGFLAGFLSGQALETCGRMGSTCAVYTVEKYGTQTHKFTKKEFAKRYQENFKDELRY